MKPAFCFSITRVIPANGVERIEQRGNFIRVKEADFAVNLGIGGDPQFDFDLGMQFRCPPGEFFEFVTLKNPTAEANTVTVLIGSGEISDDRLNVIERRNGSAPSTIPPSFAEVATIAGVANGFVKLADANPNRAKLIVYRDNEFILTPSGTSETGMPSVIQGGSFFFAVIDTKAEVWGFDLDGAVSDYRVAETTF